jgi:hypothetical protein
MNFFEYIMAYIITTYLGYWLTKDFDVIKHQFKFGCLFLFSLFSGWMIVTQIHEALS